MTLSMIALRFLLNTVSIPEVLAEWFVEITPAVVFSKILGVLEAYAKPILFVELLIAQVFIGGAFGVLYTLILESVLLDKGPRWAGGILFALVLWLLTMVLVVPIAGSGVFGGTLAGGRANFLVASLVPYMIYG